MASAKRSIKTMSRPSFCIQPQQGIAADLAASGTNLTDSHVSVALSPTHGINSTIFGADASRRILAVRWGVTCNILIALVLT
jgi:PiT family inorganic phosphate transporter